MTKSDSGEFVGFHELQPDTKNFREVSFCKSAVAQKGSVRGRIGLRYCNQYGREKLHSTSCDRERSLKVKQAEEDLHDVSAGILVSHVGLAEEDHHTCLLSALFTLLCGFWIWGRCVQSQTMPSVKLRSAREAAKGAAKRWVVRDSAECGSHSLSESEKSRQREEVGRSKSMRGGRNIPYGEVRGGGSRKGVCRETELNVSFARRA